MLIMLIYFNGLMLGFSLIMALGPQNVFLIKQGAKKNYPGLSAMICFVCDIVLICGSVAGLHNLLLDHPTLQVSMIWLGSAFLWYYAIKTLKNVFVSKKENRNVEAVTYNRAQIVLFALGFSLLNPHAIIDSLVIIGGGSSQFPHHEMAFLSGVLSASLIWFSSLTLTTRFLADVLTKGVIWQTLELCSGLLMAFIGTRLALHGLTI